MTTLVLNLAIFGKNELAIAVLCSRCRMFYKLPSLRLTKLGTMIPSTHVNFLRQPPPLLPDKDEIIVLSATVRNTSADRFCVLNFFLRPLGALAHGADGRIAEAPEQAASAPVSSA